MCEPHIALQPCDLVCWSQYTVQFVGLYRKAACASFSVRSIIHLILCFILFHGVHVMGLFYFVSWCTCHGKTCLSEHEDD